jgi:hypothetical protein
LFTPLSGRKANFCRFFFGLTLSRLGARMVRIFALPSHISSDNGLIGMIQFKKVFVGLLAMHFHT